MEISYGRDSLLLAYADDLALFLPRASYQEQVHQAVSLLHQRCVSLGFKINPDKTRYMTFGLAPLIRPLALDGIPVSRTIRHKYLGVIFDPALTFQHQVGHIRARSEARLRILRFLTGYGPARAGASPRVLRTFYVMAIRSIIDYSTPCLPGLSATAIKSLEVTQNAALRSILGAPRWTSIVTMREECGLPTIKSRIQARTCSAIAAYQRRWPHSRLSRAFHHAFNRPLATRPDRDWVHAAADAARLLGVEDVVRCGPDLPVPDHQLPPPWNPPIFTLTTFTCNKPMQLLPALLRQEALRLIASNTSPTGRHYFTDGSVSNGGAAGSAFVSGDTTVGRRIPHYATAFQAELAAIFIALNHAHETLGNNVGRDIHIFSDSVSALKALQQNKQEDNFELLSAIIQQMAYIHREGAYIHLHWVPGHVGVIGNERADTAARLAGAEAETTLHFPRSLSSLRSAFNAAALSNTKALFDTALAAGSTSARWYANATQRHPSPLSGLSSKEARIVQRLRLGFRCRAQILNTLPETCAHCSTATEHPLHHYILHCPATHGLRRNLRNHPHPQPGLEAAAWVISQSSEKTIIEIGKSFPPPC